MLATSPDQHDNGAPIRRPRMTALSVGGFKSIQNSQRIEIRPLNVLIGANGAGKSNLISFLRLLRELGEQRLQQFVAESGGPNQLLYYGVKQTQALWASIDFEGKTGSALYVFNLRSTATDTLVFGNERVDCAPINGAEAKTHSLGAGHKETALQSTEFAFPEVLDLLKGIETFHFEDTSKSSAIRLQGYIEENRTLRTDGGNLAAFLYRLKLRELPYYRRIVGTIRQIAPFFEDFDLGPRELAPNQILLNWRDRDSNYLFGAHQLSDGTLRAMALTALLGQAPEDLPGLIVLDEPEIGLHPYAVEILAGLIKSAAVHRPVIVAAQSPELVNHFEPEDVITVGRDQSESKFERQSSASLAAWLADYSMGDIWRHNLIGGNPL